MNIETIMADRGPSMLQPLIVCQPPIELAMPPAPHVAVDISP